MSFLKEFLGSPRVNTASNDLTTSTTQQLEEDDPNASILSPRNFLKMLSSGLDLVRSPASSPSADNYAHYTSTFSAYLQSLEPDYSKYLNRSSQTGSQQPNHQQLQQDMKLSRIPQEFFDEQYPLELGKRHMALKRQQQLGEYLDEVEVVLFEKAGKYPSKTHVIMDNMQELEGITEKAIELVKQGRQRIKGKLMRVDQKVKKIQLIQAVIGRVKQTIQRLELLRKMRDLRKISESGVSSSAREAGMKEQMLLRIPRTELNLCGRFVALKEYMSNIQQYRRGVKEGLYREFRLQIADIFERVLRYDKEEWKNIKAPVNPFANSSGSFSRGGAGEQDLSVGNITILDQSYFAFESGTTQAASQGGPNKEVDMGRLYMQWGVIEQFDLYEEEQLNEILHGLLVRHNSVFTADMQQYVASLSNGQPVGGGMQKMSLAQRKAKNTHNTSEHTVDPSTLLSSLQMRLYLKVVRFYYGLLAKLHRLITHHPQLFFLMNFAPKLNEFVIQRIKYFMSLKELSWDWSVEDFMTYLQLLDYWEGQQIDQVVQFCQQTRSSKVEEFLTMIQKELLIRELKQSIEQSKYVPVKLSSEHYPVLYRLLVGQGQAQQDMDTTFTQQSHTESHPSKEGESLPALRIIHNCLHFNRQKYFVCDSFMPLMSHIHKYVTLIQEMPECQLNIQQKICEIIGFYAWFNSKNLNNNKTHTKTLKNYCTFYSTLRLLKRVLECLNISSKKGEKTRGQLEDEDGKLSKTISMTPFLMIEEKVSKLYESKISTRPQVPTAESQRIIELVRIAVDCLKEYFPLEQESKLADSVIVRMLQSGIKLISKNYCGYLASMEKRGLAQLKWFVPRLKELLEVTIVVETELIDKKGERLGPHGRKTFLLFEDEIEGMERTVKMVSVIR